MTCTMPGFAASSKLLQKKWEQRQYDQHMRKVQSMRAGLDNGTPKSQPHLVVRLKKIQKEEERQSDIDRNNQILLQKLTQIMKSKGRLDNWNDYQTKSLNRTLRNKQQEQIALQNLKIAKHLETMKPMYDVVAWEDDFQKHELALVNMSKTTKDFDGPPSDRPTHRKRKPGETYSLYKHRYINCKAKNRRENHNHPKAKFNTRAPPGVKLPTIRSQGEDSPKERFEMYWGDNLRKRGSWQGTNPRRIRQPKRKARSASGDRSEGYKTENSYSDDYESYTEDEDREEIDNKDRDRGPARHEPGGRNNGGNSDSRYEDTENDNKDGQNYDNQISDGKNNSTKPENVSNTDGESLSSTDIGSEALQQNGALGVIKGSPERAKDSGFQDENDSKSVKSQSTEGSKENVRKINRGKPVKKTDKTIKSSPKGKYSKKERKPNNLIVVDKGKVNKTSPRPKEERKQPPNTLTIETPGSASQSGATARKKKGGPPKEAASDQESRLLYKVVKNMANPDDIVMKTLVRKTHEQRLATRDRFEDLYDLNLKVELKSTMGQPFHVLLDCLLADKQEDEISEIKYAIMENDPSTLVQILSTKSHSEMLRVKKQYKRHVDKTIEGHIDEAILDEECLMLLNTILREDRPWTERVDDLRAMKDAEELYESGEGRFTSDRGKFMRIINERSFAQIRQTMQNYILVTGGMTVLDSMREDNCSEDFIATVHVLGRCLSDDPEYWAERLHLSLGPDSSKFINLLLQRSEIDLPAVKRAYKKHYDVTLSQEIEKYFNKDLAPMLQNLVGKTNEAVKETKKPVAKPTPSRRTTRRKQDDKTSTLKDNPLSRNTKSASRSQNKLSYSNKTNVPQRNGTVKPVKPFDADVEVERFRKAIDLWKTNEEPLINLLVTRSNAQRQAIKSRYVEKFRVPLSDDLEGSLGNEFDEVISALLMPPAEYDAHCLHECIHGNDSMEPVLIGILATRGTKEIKEMQENYLKRYHGSLESDILDNTPGEFGKLLVRMLRGPREQGISLNRNKARDDARALSRDRQHSVNPTSEAFGRLFTLVNPTQLQTTVEEYEKLAGQTIIAGIKKARINNGEELYIDLVKAMLDPPTYMAKRAHVAMAGIAADNAMLVRALVPRAEIDLIDVKDSYEGKYGKELEEIIGGKCQGNYKALLLALLQEDHEYISRQSTMVASRQQSMVSAKSAQSSQLNGEEVADKFNGNADSQETSTTVSVPVNDNAEVTKEENGSKDSSQPQDPTAEGSSQPKPSDIVSAIKKEQDTKSNTDNDTLDWFSKVG